MTKAEANEIRIEFLQLQQQNDQHWEELRAEFIDGKFKRFRVLSAEDRATLAATCVAWVEDKLLEQGLLYALEQHESRQQEGGES